MPMKKDDGKVVKMSNEEFLKDFMEF